MMPTKLPARLQCIADEIPEGNRLIDVGSDHGFISSYALETNRVQSVIATDIHRAPAERTREYLTRQGFSNRFEVFCCDGLNGIKPESADTVVIAGIGGLEIIQILSSALAVNEAFSKGTVFLFQPQRSEEELRTFLSENMFAIVSEKICFDRGRTYMIIRCEYIGEPFPLNLEQRILGPYILKERPAGTDRYLLGKMRSLEKQRLGRPELDSIIQFVKKLLSDEGGSLK